jgi:hypothetical protein
MMPAAVRLQATSALLCFAAAAAIVPRQWRVHDDQDLPLRLLCPHVHCHSQFLQSIKELNAGRQSREDTLRRSREIFGPLRQDLYGE